MRNVWVRSLIDPTLSTVTDSIPFGESSNIDVGVGTTLDTLCLHVSRCPNVFMWAIFGLNDICKWH